LPSSLLCLRTKYRLTGIKKKTKNNLKKKKNPKANKGASLKIERILKEN